MNLEIGFADSTIQTYKVNVDNIILEIELWNAELVKINFINYFMLNATSNFGISDFQEVYSSALLEQALNLVYDEIPKEHNLRVFRLIDTNNLIAFEVVCEDIQIKRNCSNTI